MIKKTLLLAAVCTIALLCARIIVYNLSYLLNHLDRFYGLLVGFLFFGCLLSVQTRYLLVKNWLGYFSTRVHEGAHEKMALLSGRRLFEFQVNPDGSGHIVYEHHGSHSPLITLAPYYFSYYGLALLVMRWALVSKWIFYFDILTGLSLAFHTYMFITQTRLYQTDLHMVGKVYSMAFIAAMHCITYSIYLCVIGGISLKYYLLLF